MRDPAHVPAESQGDAVAVQLRHLARRLDELEPSVDEYYRLEAATRALDEPVDLGRRFGRGGSGAAPRPNGSRGGLLGSSTRRRAGF
jgi:hypothetical protein